MKLNIFSYVYKPLGCYLLLSVFTNFVPFLYWVAWYGPLLAVSLSLGPMKDPEVQEFYALDCKARHIIYLSGRNAERLIFYSEY